MRHPAATKCGSSFLSSGPFVLWVVGLLLFFAMPFTEQRRNVHDESNLRNAFAISATSGRADLSSGNISAASQMTVYGKRSSGAESFLVLNCGSSTKAVDLLATVIRDEPYYSMDIYFYFLKSCADAEFIELPQGLVRGGLLMKIDTDSPASISVHTFGRGGLQPNQDLVNTVVAAFRARGFTCSFLEAGSAANLIDSFFGFVSSYLPEKKAAQSSHFSAYALSMIRNHRATYGGGALRSARGVYLVGVSSVGEWKAKDATMDLATAAEYVLRSFNNLNERLHHSCPVWVSLSVDIFLDFQLVQIVAFLFIGVSVFSACRCFIRAKELSLGRSILPFATIPIFFVCSPIPAPEAGSLSAVLIGVFSQIFWRSTDIAGPIMSTWSVVWMTLYLAIHPMLSVLGSLIIALQVCCLAGGPLVQRITFCMVSVLLLSLGLREVLPDNAEYESDMPIRSFVFTSFMLASGSALRVIFP